SVANHAVTPSSESGPDARAAAVRSTPVATRNRNRLAARSSADFKATVTPDSLHYRKRAIVPFCSLVMRRIFPVMDSANRDAVDELLQTYGETGGINSFAAAASRPPRL